jgi:GTP-binding protein
VTGEGLDGLRYRLGELVAAQRARSAAEPETEELVIRLQPRDEGFSIERDDAARYVVRGRRIERWVQMLPIEIPDAARYLQGRLKRAGVERALVEAGARHGDDVVIGDAVFEFTPDLEDLPPDEREAVLAGAADAEDDLADGSEEDLDDGWSSERAT